MNLGSFMPIRGPGPHDPAAAQLQSAADFLKPGLPPVTASGSSFSTSEVLHHVGKGQIAFQACVESFMGDGDNIPAKRKGKETAEDKAAYELVKSIWNRMPMLMDTRWNCVFREDEDGEGCWGVEGGLHV